jgi:hypothetical protein
VNNNKTYFVLHSVFCRTMQICTCLHIFQFLKLASRATASVSAIYIHIFARRRKFALVRFCISIAGRSMMDVQAFAFSPGDLKNLRGGL